MAFRKSANSRGYKKQFTRNALKVHKRNLIISRPMRGGIRL